MKRSRLNAKERQLLSDVSLETTSLRADWPRRLRNALIALAAEDPYWMMWVERNIPSPCALPDAARLVESRARALVLKHHGYFGNQKIAMLILRDQWVFADDGHLIVG